MITLQSKIEKLQARRYYPLQEGWTVVDDVGGDVEAVELTASFLDVGITCGGTH